jgi:hypothetical protein
LFDDINIDNKEKSLMRNVAWGIGFFFLSLW